MASESELLTLTLTPDNPCNTKITDAGGAVVYVVYTEHGKHASTTRIFDAAERVVASVTWNDLGIAGDKVALGDGAPMDIGKWLHKSMIPFVDSVTFKDATGKQFKWKGNAPGFALELYSEDDKFAQTIARFHRSRKDNRTDPPGAIPATLVLASRAVEVQDLVVSSFLFLERPHRLNDKSSDRVANMAWGATY